MQNHELTIRIHIAVSERPMYTSSASVEGDDGFERMTFLSKSGVRNPRHEGMEEIHTSQ